MIGDLGTAAALTAADLRYRRPFLARVRDFRAAQEKTLRRLLSANAGTEFGRMHGFARLAGRAEYSAAVPVQTHETLAEAIWHQAETGAPVLTAEPPVFYARTSGTTAPARDFPVTASAQSAQHAAQRVLAATLYRGSGFFDGRIAGLGGAHIEGRLPSGQLYGSASGQTYATAPLFVRARFVVPESVFYISDPVEKYHAYALSLLAAEDLTGIVTANPTTVLSMLAHVRRHAEAVLRDLAGGSFTIFDDSRGAEALSVAAAAPGRARALEAVLADGAPIGRVWPRLNTLATWTGGNCQVALDQLLPALPEGLRVVEIGYRASELIGTINVDATENACVPDVTHTVFEFAEEEAWEAGGADFLWLDEIEAGRRYYLFATTPSGLYRYHINDVVEVTGHFGSCPLLAFVRKGQGVTSITGEKLHEAQAIEAVRAARADRLPPGYFMVVADPAAAVYRLFLEAPALGPDCAAIGAAFDAALCAGNIEYAAKRASGRLGPVEAVLVRPGTGEAVKSACVAAGQREAQVKPPALVDAGRFSFDFGPHRWDPEP